jgi:hypothetical protein
MGGHAVRFYGLQRYTNDFDLTLAPDGWDDLADRLTRTGLFPDTGPVEGNSWRPGAFRRFLLGNLADGQEEWLEFWRGNHLLAPFVELFARRQIGAYGGQQLAFLSLPDLICGPEVIHSALERATNPITQAFLLPWTPVTVTATPVVPIEPVVERKLRSIPPASSLHRSIVEVVRRQYKVFCQDRDRMDKEAIRTAQAQKPK